LHECADPKAQVRKSQSNPAAIFHHIVRNGNWGHSRTLIMGWPSSGMAQISAGNRSLKFPAPKSIRNNLMLKQQGISTLRHGVTTLRRGVTTLCRGVTTLCRGVTTLCRGVTTLCRGLTTLYHGVTKIRRKVSAGTPTSSSALAPHSDDTEETPRNPVRQNARPILALAGFKRVISMIKYQEFMLTPLT
jgi:hypothetical protein